MMRSALIAIVAATVGCKPAAPPPAAGSGSTTVAAPAAATPPTAGSAMPSASGSATPPGAATPAAPGAATPPGSAPPPASGAATPPASTPASGKPLRDALVEAAAGKPVLLALDAKGALVARTVDGSYASVLAPGPYGDALHDGALDLVWLRRDTGLDVLDLRLPGPPAAKPLATAPAKALEQLGEHIVKPPHWDMTSSVVVDLATPCSKSTGLVLDWSKGGAGTTTGGEGVKIVAKDWFAAQDHRSAREVPPGFTRKLAKPHKVPAGVGTCHADAHDELGKTACGHGLYFGATNYELVVVSASADKCPAKQCRRYDGATKQFTAVPGVADDAAAASCGPLLFDGTGTSYLVGDQVCADQACASVGLLAVGWLDGNRVLDAN